MAIAGVVKLILWLPSNRPTEVVRSETPAPEAATSVAESTPWPGVEYAEIRAYYDRDWPKDPAHPSIFDHVDPNRGVQLSADQQQRLITAVNARVPGYAFVDMFYPQNAFVLFDASGKVLRELDICFDSFFVLGHEADFPDILALAELVDDLGLPVGDYKSAEDFRMGFKDLQEAAKRSHSESP